MQLGLHRVRVEVDVAVHALNVHLVRRTREAVILRVVAAEVFNERLFQKLEDGLIVLRVYRDFKAVHAAVSTLDRADLDSAVGRQVTPELSEVLSIVVLEDKDSITDVFLHVVHEVGLQEVDSVLQGAAPTNERDFLRVVLDRDKGETFPVQGLLVTLAVLHLNIGLLLSVRREYAVLKDVGRDAFQREEVDLLNDFLLGTVVDLDRIKAKSGVKLGVSCVRPERHNLVAGEYPECELAVFIVIGIKPRDTRIEALDSRALESTHKPHAEYLLDLGCVIVILAGEGNRLTEKVVCLLVNVFRILVIHNAVVREILNHNQLTVRADSRALAFENVMVSGIVPVAVNHLAPFRRSLPVGKLSRVELKLGHRPAGAEAQTEKLLLDRLLE